MSYKTISVNGKQKRLHRHIVEQSLGRKLLSSEIIHHKDGDKLNNDISNLEITNRAEHAKHHIEQIVTAQGSLSRKYEYNEEDITRLYVVDRMPTHKISKIIGIPTSSVNFFVRKNNIKRPFVYCECGEVAKYIKAKQCSKCYLKDYYAKHN